VSASKSTSGTAFDGREWVNDWYGVLPADDVRDPGGPISGLTKVIRAGPHRYALPTEAKSMPWGMPAASFRVVLVQADAWKLSFTPMPFNQSAVKQTKASELSGPHDTAPFFHVRFAVPIPEENSAAGIGAIAGLDPSVMAHLHSPGFEVLPN